MNGDPASLSSKNMTPEKLAEYRRLVPLGIACGVGGAALAALLDEIERLTRERDQLLTAIGETEQQKVEAERDRLRAVLEEVRRCLPGTLERVPELRDRIDQALFGEPNSAVETSGAPVATAQLLEAVAGAVPLIREDICDCERDGEETHRHLCRKFGLELKAPETAAKPTDSELYGSSELFRHIWVCPMGWIGDKLIYGPGYTLADMKPWLVKLRRLAGFEHPEGTPLEQPEKASDRPSVKPPKFCAMDGCYNRVADDQEVCDSCSQNGNDSQ